jgi:hypothetical protein
MKIKMSNEQLITMRRALLNYRDALLAESLEGLDESTSPDCQWTSAEWGKELQNVTRLLEKYSVKADTQN